MTVVVCGESGFRADWQVAKLEDVRLRKSIDTWTQSLP